MSKKPVLELLLTVILIFGVTTVIFLYTSGYRLEQPGNLRRTGMISTKSIPEGASVYLDGVLTTATNGTVSGLEPKTYTLKITKNGYVTWEKPIPVFPELVTDITAVLVAQTPRLEPLTNTGAGQPSISPSLTKLAYLSKDTIKPGIWVIPLSQGGLSLFRATPYIVVADIPKKTLSTATSIEWSPDEKKLLVQGANNTFDIVDLQTNVAQSTSSAENIRKTWNDETVKKRSDFIEKLGLSKNIAALAVSAETVWSPDDKKFLYTVETSIQREYRVYNLEKPLPVGEKVDNLVFSIGIKDPQPKVTWYYDSYHLILTELDQTRTKGRISLVRIDGSNKTEIYNNSLYSDAVYSSPSGDKLIILTSFKSASQTDLYTLGIH